MRVEDAFMTYWTENGSDVGVASRVWLFLDPDNNTVLVALHSGFGSRHHVEHKVINIPGVPVRH